MWDQVGVDKWVRGTFRTPFWREHASVVIDVRTYAHTHTYTHTHKPPKEEGRLKARTMANKEPALTLKDTFYIQSTHKL